MTDPTDKAKFVLRALEVGELNENDLAVFLARDVLAMQERLRRKHILDQYAICIEPVIDFDEWVKIISSDERIAKWFGEPLPDYVLKELNDNRI
jgi:hypothetical protein